MDFLDPRHKKAHRQRLLVGYILVAFALALATWLLLKSSYGFWVDPVTGNIIQNGTIFLDSQPNGSTVYLDGVVQRNTTDTRLVVPGSKQYAIKLENDGYRDWTRTLVLDGGQIERLKYPLLIPKKLVSNEVQLYASQPGITTQSEDKRWLLVQPVKNSPKFDLFDLNNPTASPASLTLPAAAMTAPKGSSSFKAIKWSADNNHVLLERFYGKSGREFIILNTENTDSTVNINKSLGVEPTAVAFRNKESSQVYLLDKQDGRLRLADTRGRTISAPIADKVLAFESFGPNTLLYVTAEGAKKSRVNLRIRDNNQASYLLRTLPADGKYMLDAAEFDGRPYFAVGSETENVAFIYRDPLPTLKGQRSTPLLVSAVLRLAKPKFVSFSLMGQFVYAQAGRHLIVYDIEDDRQFNLDLKNSPQDGLPLSWVDNYHLTFNANSKSYIIDFDGSNEQRLVKSLNDYVYFSSDNETVFSVAASSTVKGRYALTQTSLIKQ